MAISNIDHPFYVVIMLALLQLLDPIHVFTSANVDFSFIEIETFIVNLLTKADSFEYGIIEGPLGITALSLTNNILGPIEVQLTLQTSRQQDCPSWLHPGKHCAQSAAPCPGIILASSEIMFSLVFMTHVHVSHFGDDTLPDFFFFFIILMVLANVDAQLFCSSSVLLI